MRFFHPSNQFNPNWRLGRSRRRGAHAAPPAPVPLPVAPLAPEDVLLCARTKVKVGGITYLAGQRLTGAEADLVQALRQGDAWRVRPSGVDWWTAPGRVLAVEPCSAQPFATAPTEGALRIAMGSGYDPGNAVYRFHSAVNEHTRHASAFLAWRVPGGNPFRCPEQYDGQVAHRAIAPALVYEADVLHHHVDYYLGSAGLGAKPRPGQLLILHYHGSRPPGGGEQWAIQNADRDDALGAVLCGARLTLCALRPGRIHWLPIAVPVARYAAMVPVRPANVFRIAHSATRDDYKGTRELVAAVDTLRAKGLPIELVLIGYRRRGKGITLEPHRRTHAEALRMKAACHVTFDSFWLGIQGSGLEAAAMGQPVLAGDPDVAALYREHVGHVPYTFAGDQRSLTEQIERLATDPAYYAAEAARVGAYVRAYHDYPAVARIYEGILSAELGRDVRTVRADLPKLPPVTPRRPVTRPQRPPTATPAKRRTTKKRKAA